MPRKPIRRGLDGVNFSKIPDKPGRRSAPKGPTGKRTGFGICHFMYRMFQYNEDAAPTRKITNATLEREVLAEFPTNETLKRNIYGRQRINWWRNNYNRGILMVTLGKPKKVSLRYNENGQVVDYRSGRRVLSIPEIQMICEYYAINDPRYMKPNGTRKAVKDCPPNEGLEKSRAKSG